MPPSHRRPTVLELGGPLSAGQGKTGGLIVNLMAASLPPRYWTWRLLDPPGHVQAALLAHPQLFDAASLGLVDPAAYATLPLAEVLVARAELLVRACPPRDAAAALLAAGDTRARVWRQVARGMDDTPASRALLGQAADAATGRSGQIRDVGELLGKLAADVRSSPLTAARRALLRVEASRARRSDEPLTLGHVLNVADRHSRRTTDSHRRRRQMQTAFRQVAGPVVEPARQRLGGDVDAWEAALVLTSRTQLATVDELAAHASAVADALELPR